MESSAQSIAYELLENTILPSILLFFTSCAICLWLGVFVGAYLSNLRMKAPMSSSAVNDGKSKADKYNVVSLQMNSSVYPKRIVKTPKHVAIIMDGNRRYGREKHSNSVQGHWAGGQKLIDVVQWCVEDDIRMLTVYAFSTENWNRDPVEIAALMNIFIQHADTLKKEAVSKNIRVKILATSPEKLPDNVATAVRELELISANCTGFQLNICLSYGSRAEIAEACKRIAMDVKCGILEEKLITESTVSQYLQTATCPDPDILIRTSGEYRLSNFLLYQMAYTEMFFLNKYWPEISQEDFRDVLRLYTSRDRRYGG